MSIIYHPSEYLPINEIRSHYRLRWSREYLSMNHGITINDVLLGLGVGEWNWKMLTRIIPEEDVINNPSLPWCKEDVNWTIKSMYHRNMNDVITMRDKPWCPIGLSNNKNITIDVIKLYHVDELLWSSLTSVMDINVILANTSLPWDRSVLASKYSMTSLRFIGLNNHLEIDYMIYPMWMKRCLSFISDVLNLDDGTKTISNVSNKKLTIGMIEFLYRTSTSEQPNIIRTVEFSDITIKAVHA